MPDPSPKRLAMSRKPTQKGKHWTDRDKLKVIAAFSVLGNATKVEEVTGVPANTINYWKTLPWWFEEMERLRKTEDEAMISGYGKLIKQTIEKLHERIETGDIVVLKDGNQVAIPVKARDLAIISGLAADKRTKLRQHAVEDTSKNLTMQDRLKSLEAQFTRFVTSKVVEGEVTFKETETEAPNERIEEGHEETREEGVEELREEGRHEEDDERQEGEVLNALQVEEASQNNGGSGS